MADKIFCGSGKTINSEYGEFYSITVDLEAMFAAFKAGHGYEGKNNGKKYIKLNLNKRREVSQYGETHSLTVDTWKPDPNRQATGSNPAPIENRQGPPASSFESEIPF